MGVAVALHNLGGMRVHLQVQPGQGAGLQVGRKKGVGAHCAGNLAHAHAFQPGPDALPVAHELRIKAQDFEAEAGGFCVDAVGAAHAEHAFMTLGQIRQSDQQRVKILEDQRSGLDQQQGVGRVHNVRRCAAQVDVARLGPHFFFQRSQKGDDVVPGHLFNGQNAVHIDGRRGLDVRQGVGGHAAQFAPGLAHGQLHVEPGPVAVFQGPDAAHCRPGITIDHACLMRPRERAWTWWTQRGPPGPPQGRSPLWRARQIRKRRGRNRRCRRRRPNRNRTRRPWRKTRLP